MLHRDLHDKQVVVGAHIGLLDLDTLAVGERALDLANALAHLELRVDQGLMTAAAAGVARRAFLEGADPDPETRERIPATWAWRGFVSLGSTPSGPAGGRWRCAGTHRRRARPPVREPCPS